VGLYALYEFYLTPSLTSVPISDIFRTDSLLLQKLDVTLSINELHILKSVVNIPKHNGNVMSAEVATNSMP